MNELKANESLSSPGQAIIGFGKYKFENLERNRMDDLNLINEDKTMDTDEKLKARHGIINYYDKKEIAMVCCFICMSVLSTVGTIVINRKQQQ
ncbi:MAG: hypothetical protein LIO49_06665 [Ruminococcus sp.]|nr:hypothetical protein [Ruminococcus sp.]MCD7804917.1 hypothetical protein [Oscillospiraceae bacterium]